MDWSQIFTKNNPIKIIYVQALYNISYIGDGCPSSISYEIIYIILFTSYILSKNFLLILVLSTDRPATGLLLVLKIRSNRR